MPLDENACLRALRTRDRRFDGRFFAAVATTGIYCRPICPARGAKRENLRFFPSAAAAECAGFRPCLRCRPERAPGVAPVDAAARLVAAAVAGIEQHALSGARVGELAAALGVTDRHLRRVMNAELGVSPIELAQTQRLLLAKRLLHETPLSQTEIAFASGFASLRRFNAAFKARYGASPRAVRGRVRQARTGRADGLRCRLEFRPPLAWTPLLDYLRERAVAGVEAVDARAYRRTVAIGGLRGWIAVSLAPGGRALEVELARSLAPAIGGVIARVKDLFDLGAVPAAIAAQLGQDPGLAPLVRRLPGLRVPGAFDGFETAVRIVLGQLVSVRAASTAAARVAAAFGEPCETPFADLDRLTPTAERLAAAGPAELAALGLAGTRARALAALADAVAAGRLRPGFVADVESALRALEALPGIGPWTAQMIAMRVFRSPDAFPAGDLILRRLAGTDARTLQARSLPWRPWRAYAAHYLWQSRGGTPA